MVAGEAEVGAPWTPANVQCDSYCQMRARTFFEPLAVVDQNLEVQGFLAESIEPNDDYTVWTIKLREGISFTDGTPLNADAAIDNVNRGFLGSDPRRRAEGHREERRWLDRHREGRRLHVHDLDRQERRRQRSGRLAAVPLLPRWTSGLHGLTDVAGRRRRR